ncbi:MAG: hypothetical protein ACHQ3P_06395 [Candidatus Limnocylindrales bacterium]
MDRWLRISVVLALAAVIGACGGSSTPAPVGGGPASQSVAPSAPPTEAIGPTDTGMAGASASSGSGGSTGTVTGSVVSSGAYAATWTWQPPNAVDPGEVVLTSDKDTFGDLQVDTDGSITFSVGVPKLADASPFTGVGGTQTVKQVAGSPTVCGIAVDSDVTGSDGTVLHLKGSLTINGTVTGDVGDITC